MTTTPSNLPKSVRKYMASIGKKGGAAARGDKKRRDMYKGWETRRRNAERRAKEAQQAQEVAANVV